MLRLSRISRCLLVVFAAFALTIATSSSALALDKVTLKDGTVLEGEIVREGEGFLFIKYKIGTMFNERIITSDQIAKIERDSSKSKDADKDKKDESDKVASADAKKGDPKTKPSLKGATKVAILNFGPPSSWQGKVESTVGIEIAAQAFKDVIPKLEKAGAQIVIIRVNSGGGLGLEVPKFQELFEKEYKPRFRTVAWIESAISAAAMSPYVIEEMYFLPEGNLGACTGWYGALQNVEGVELEQYLIMMEQASHRGKRDPKIMRAMQIQDPLSANIDENTGEVTWLQNEDGQYVLNPRGHIFTINASDAVKFKFAKGIAATKDELAKVMGLEEVEWVAQDASDYIDENMRECDKSEKSYQNAENKYLTARGLAEQLQNCKDRGGQIAIARRYLAEMRRLAKLNPNFMLMRNYDEEFFRVEDERLRKLAC